jgi:uncharacterized protein (TIGR02246 family)
MLSRILFAMVVVLLAGTATQLKAQDKVIIPPFTQESAIEKLKINEAAWNSKDPEKIASLYADDAEWRDGVNFIKGRTAIKSYLEKKFIEEKNFVTKKEVWGAKLSKNAIRFEDEWLDAATKKWYHSYGVEVVLFNDQGLITERFASYNSKRITQKARLFK